MGLFCFYVYLWRNKANGKCYVGVSGTPVGQRYREHVRASRKQRKGGLAGAIAKYGPDGFDVVVLEQGLTRSEAETREIYYIERYSTLAPGGYNLDRGGSAGARLTAESRAKMSAAKKGKTLSEQARKKLSLAGKGRPHTALHKHRIACAMTGKTWSPLRRERFESRRAY